jgi:hypothetical protein
VVLSISIKNRLGMFHKNDAFRTSFELPSSQIFVVSSFCGTGHQMTFLKHKWISDLKIPTPVLNGVDTWGQRD